MDEWKSPLATCIDILKKKIHCVAGEAWKQITLLLHSFHVPKQNRTFMESKSPFIYYITTFPSLLRNNWEPIQFPEKQIYIISVFSNTCCASQFSHVCVCEIKRECVCVGGRISQLFPVTEQNKETPNTDCHQMPWDSILKTSEPRRHFLFYSQTWEKA